MAVKPFITGATGLIGYNLVQKLLKEGVRPRLLVRSPARARQLFPKGCEFIEGDITDALSLAGALKGCDLVFHAAGLPEQWLRDKRIFQSVNVGGTENLVEASLAAKVKKFIYVSTIDVFKAGKGAVYDESLIDDAPKHTAYERSKQLADAVVVAAIERGLKPVFVHPAGLFGPGPESSPGINDLIVKIAKRQVPSLLPGALPLVYAPDLANGILLATKKASKGNRFIFSSYYFTLRELYKQIAAHFQIARVPFTLPLPLAKTVSYAMEAAAKMTHKPPLIPRGQLEFLQWQARPSSVYAQKKLKWHQTPFAEALDETIVFLKDYGRL